MAIILHILTQPEDALAQTIIAEQRRQPGTTVETADLSQAKPDYSALVERIFAADSVEVW